MDLCRQRPAGFGYYVIFGYSLPLPTACTIDAVLVPLPTIALVVALIFARRLRLFYSRTCLDCGRYHPHVRAGCVCIIDEEDEKRASTQLSAQLSRGDRILAIRPVKTNQQCSWSKWLEGFMKYYQYVALLFLSYKLGRETYFRGLANQGLGFLPITFAGVLLVTLLYYLDQQTQAHTRARLLTAIYWWSLCTIISLKIIVLLRSKDQTKSSVNEENQRYSTHTQMLDALGMQSALIPLASYDITFYENRKLQEERDRKNLESLLDC